MFKACTERPNRSSSEMAGRTNLMPGVCMAVLSFMTGHRRRTILFRHF